MSLLEVTFPDEWLALPGLSGRAGARPVTPGDAVLRGASPPGRHPAAPPLDVQRLASVALPEPTGEGLQAYCVIGVVHHASGTDAELRAVAERSPRTGLERDTLTVELALGRAARSSAFRFADELLDEDVVPFAAEIRFALPLPGRRIGVLHFETRSLRDFEQLENLFDTIAGTARVA